MRTSAIFSLLVLAATLAACGPLVRGEDQTTVTVMTQDLAVGADVQAVLASPPAELAARAEAMWLEKDRTSFATRAGKIAAGIAANGPDLVGLQSVVLWRREATASAVPAEEVVADYLEILLAALAARGAAYDPVAIGTTTDVELTGTSGSDYRFTDREVILARRGLVTSGVLAGTYLARRALTAGGAVSGGFGRGWVAVDAEKGGKTLRFVSTHLDASDPAVQAAQATELLRVAEPGAATIVVGDLGSDPREAASWPGYSTLVTRTSGYADGVASAGAAFPTCCRDVGLVDPAAVLDRRVDVVLHTSHFQSWSGARTNGGPGDMVDGLWPSTHAGVVATLQFQ